MDRASDSGSEGWGFESLPVYQIKERIPIRVSSLLFRASCGKGLERAAPVRTLVQKVSGGHFLARGRVHWRKTASHWDVGFLQYLSTKCNSSPFRCMSLNEQPPTFLLCVPLERGWFYLLFPFPGPRRKQHQNWEYLQSSRQHIQTEYQFG